MRNTCLYCDNDLTLDEVKSDVDMCEKCTDFFLSYNNETESKETELPKVQ